MAAAEPDNFFKQKRTTSEIKDKILPAFFKTWCNLNRTKPGSQEPQELLFVDVNVGEGYNPAGEPAAPIIMLEGIYKSAQAGEEQALEIFFINPTPAITEKLKHNLEQLPFYPVLPQLPELLTEVAFQEKLVTPAYNLKPTLIFLNPARPDLTRQLLSKALASSSTDLLLIFNYNKLHQTLLSGKADEWENAFWGDKLNQVKNVGAAVAGAKKRESHFIQILEVVFKEAGFYPFKFNITAPGKNPASQYLLLLTRKLPAYLAIKDIMQAYSEYQEDGIPLFEATNKPPVTLLPGFFQYLSTYTLESLVEELARNRSRFHYLTLQAIYEEHSVGTNYIKANYKTALEKLQNEGLLYPVNAQNKKINAITDTSVIFYNLHSRKK